MKKRLDFIILYLNENKNHQGINIIVNKTFIPGLIGQYKLYMWKKKQYESGSVFLHALMK